jgi:hypothetical protein
MRDYLLDLVEHTYDLGCVDVIKIAGTDTATAISGSDEPKTLVITGKFHTPVADFIGTFGMPNLSKLKTVLGLQEYRENAQLTITHRADNGKPDGILFKNSAGDFSNTYRFMEEALANQRVADLKFKEPTWHVEFEPTVAGITRLKMQAQANAEESLFQAKTENGDLKFFFGDHSTHAGNFVFQPGVTGQLKRNWSWPVKHIISIMDLTGDKVVRFSDDGVCDIRVDSGIALYRYFILAHSK